MSMKSPSRGSGSMDSIMRLGSTGGKSSQSHSQLLHSRSPTKPRRQQSAHLDVISGKWTCKKCDFAYAELEPHHHVRREHKKICPGALTYHRLLSNGSGLSTDEDSQGHSHVDKPTSPKTPDTVSSKLAVGEEDKKDGAKKVRAGDLARSGDSEITGDGVQTPQLRDRDVIAQTPQSRDESARDSEMQEGGDAKAGAHGEQLPSQQPMLMDSEENSGALRDSESANENVSKPRFDDPGQKQSLQASDSSLSGFEFVVARSCSGGANREGRDIDMEEPLSLSSQNEADGLKKGGQPIPASDESEVKGQAEDSGEGFEPWGRSSTAADSQAEAMQKSEDRDISFSADDNTQKEKANISQDRGESALTLTEEGGAQLQRQQMGGAYGGTDGTDALLRDQEMDVGSKDGTHGTHHAEHEDPNAVAEDGMDKKGGDGRQSDQFAGGVEDELSQIAALHGQSDPSQQHATEDVGDGDGVGAGLSKPASAAVEGASETPIQSRGAEHPSRPQRNSEDWEHLVSGEGRSGKPNMLPFLQETNEADDAGEPFSGDGLTSRNQPDLSEHDSAGEKAPPLESTGAVLKSEGDAGNELGSQPEVLDWESLLDKAIERQRRDPLGSTSADHHLSPDQDRAEVVPKSDQEEEGGNDRAEVVPKSDQEEEGGNDDEDRPTTAPTSQQQADQTKRELMRLTAAEANWDDWEDVINEFPMLIDGVTRNKTDDPGSSKGDDPGSTKGDDPGSSKGDDRTPGVDSLRGGDVSEPGQGMTGTVLEYESVESVINTASAENPIRIPESECSDWLIDFSEPSENNSGQANEATPPALAASSPPKLDSVGSNFFDLLLLNEGPSQELGASSSDLFPVPSQSESGQISKVLSPWSSALRNWDDWEDVVRESEPVEGAEKMRPVSESDLGVGEHQSRIEPPNPAKKEILESGSTRPAESVEALKSPPVTNNKSGAAVALGRGVEDGLNHKKQPNLMATSDPDDADTLFRSPKPVVVPRAGGNGLPKSREFPDSGFGRMDGRKGTHADEDTSRRGESGQAGEENVPPAQEDWDDWEDVRKNEYVPDRSRHSSPSFGDAHDGELSSESEYPIALESAVKLPLGKKRWADWADLAKSEYMVLDGPGGESLVFKRSSDARDSPSAKASRGRGPPAFEEPDNGGGSPRLRRGRRQSPSLNDDKPPSSRPPRAASRRGAVHSVHSHPSYSPTKPDSHPAYSPRKSEAEDNPSLLITRRPLLYRDSRRDYTSEAEDMDVTSVPKDQIVHHHHDHSLHEHEDALKYDVEKVLHGQTKYDLICPICGAVITRKIVLRKKKRRFISEGDSRWRRNDEITPVEDDGNQTPRSDTSSEFEDASAAWKQGVRPCFGFFFGSS